MKKINFTKEEIEALKKERCNQHHPRVMDKLDIVYYKSKGLENSLICEILDVCDNTVRAYIRQYQAGGCERLIEVNFNKPISELAEYSETIKQYFTENPPHSIAEASKKIKELTGIKRGETQTRKFLKSLKFKYIKTCSVPAKALTDEKKTNKENFWKKSSNPD
jgi:transposase